MTVDGTMDRVGERALRAFRRVGKVQQVDLPSAQIEGVIKIDGNLAQTRVTWRPEGESRSRLDIAASSEDTLNRAADSALYTYARSYKAVGWPDPERDRLEQKQQRTTVAIGAFLLLALSYGLFIAAGFFRNR